jgi:hypothetical protein
LADPQVPVSEKEMLRRFIRTLANRPERNTGDQDVG